jgi:Family of unknown function (DUF6527)
MRHILITHEFVEYIPGDLAEAVLYISITYRTAVHRCVCGCGNKVVTPISPADWQLFYDGDTVSLTPSIGSWGFPCRSHYWITSNQVQWSGAWTDKRITAGRARDDRDRQQYFAGRTPRAHEPKAAETIDEDRRSPFAWLRRLLRH